jgi:hypothetical protein
MKKLITVIALATLGLGVQASSTKSCDDKDNSCCCTDTQSSKSAKAQTASKQAKTGHSDVKTSTNNRPSPKQPLQSPKALADSR